MQTCTARAQTFIGLGLMAIMAATRFHHFGDVLHLPDASWAIFFLAGFYLAPVWLAVFLLQAVAIDFVAIEWLGTSAFCVTPAYAALVPAYAALWFGGRWLARNASIDGKGALKFAGAGFAATSMAYLISNASFYWLGGNVGETGLTAYIDHFIQYYPHFLLTTLLYLAVAAAAHGFAPHLARGGALPNSR